MNIFRGFIGRLIVALIIPTLYGCNDDVSSVTIGTVEDLITFRNRVNDSDDDGYSDGYMSVTLTADLDLEGIEWEPIGNDVTSYYADFNGNGHTISNLTINSAQPYQGLFGFVEQGTIKNLTIKNPQITGGQYVGAVVGRINDDSAVDNCKVIGGSVSGYRYVGGVVGASAYWTPVEDCYNTAEVSGTTFVGGVVGHASSFSTVENCYNTGAVSALSNYVGGVVGYTYYTPLLACYNTGSVTGAENHVGGVTGRSSAYVIACYNTGDVTGVESVGGVAGSSEDLYSNYTATITSCYNTGGVYGENYVGGVVGASSAGTVDCYYVEVSDDNALYGVGDTQSNVGVEALSSTAELNTSAVVNAMNNAIEEFEIDEDNYDIYDDNDESFSMSYRYALGSETPKLERY